MPRLRVLSLLPTNNNNLVKFTTLVRRASRRKRLLMLKSCPTNSTFRWSLLLCQSICSTTCSLVNSFLFTMRKTVRGRKRWWHHKFLLMVFSRKSCRSLPTSSSTSLTLCLRPQLPSCRTRQVVAEFKVRDKHHQPPLIRKTHHKAKMETPLEWPRFQ